MLIKIDYEAASSTVGKLLPMLPLKLLKLSFLKLHGLKLPNAFAS